MTYCALAKARASPVLLSYSCGSAFGSVTMLVTLTCDPPSWLAMLPQKFSAATTCKTVPDAPPVALEAGCTAGVPQAASIRASPIQLYLRHGLRRSGCPCAGCARVFLMYLSPPTRDAARGSDGSRATSCCVMRCCINIDRSYYTIDLIFDQ